ncbi:MAG: outer membrane lipoprotein LolB [Ketobacter sp.]|nr:outer membrane lipoprotein LolB [Ketobacter sp.]
MPVTHPLLRLTLLLLSLTLGGCQLWQPSQELATPQPGQPKLNWVAHVRALTLLQEWQIKGKIGVRTSDDGGSAYIDWSQSFDSFYILLSGPLGQGSTIVSGNPYGARLENSEGTFLSESPEHLIAQHTGWAIPIHQLLYWIKGIPSPHGKSTLQHNALGTLQSLQQEGWKLEFDRYTNVMGTLLPQRIKIHKEDLKVTLIIKEWLPLASPEDSSEDPADPI